MQWRMQPAQTTKRTPAPERLTERITDVADTYVIGHFGIASLRDDEWGLTITGLTAETVLGLDALRALPPVSITTVLECFGNPLEPHVPTRRVANVVWHGVLIRDVLNACTGGIEPAATTLWATGADSGRFAGTHCTEYRKDVPLDVALDRGIVAIGINGAPLTPEHGYPARLVIPGYFGTNNVKWLTTLTIANRRPQHLFTTDLYQRVPAQDPEPVPVRDLDVNSLITSPAHEWTVPVFADSGGAGIDCL